MSAGRIKRGDVLGGKTKRIKTGCGTMYVTINFDDASTPIEIFARLGKAGGCASSQTEAIGRLATLALRHGANVGDIIKQLGGIGCHTPSLWGEDGKVLSCADAISRALSKLCGLDATDQTNQGG